MALYDLIEEAIQNAKENGYEVLEYSDMDLAIDLTNCDSEIGSYSFQCVLEAIKEIRKNV